MGLVGRRKMETRLIIAYALMGILLAGGVLLARQIMRIRRKRRRLMSGRHRYHAEQKQE